MQEIYIYSDGACRGNPGPGGWGALVVESEQPPKELHGAEKVTTNNRMELMAAIEGLRQIKNPSRITLVTDSQYVQKGMKEWLPGWIRKKWKTAGGKAVKNRDLWEELLQLSRPHKVTWEWVRGHNGHPENERCDALANEAIDKLMVRGNGR